MHDLGRPRVEMLTNRGRAGERGGAFEKRDVIGLTDAACRTLTNLQGAQEFLAVPQRYVGAREEDFQTRGLTALFWSDVNPYSTFRLAIDKRLDLGPVAAVPHPRTPADTADRSTRETR